MSASSHLVRGSRSPALSLWSSSTGLERYSRKRFWNSVRTISTAKRTAVSAIPGRLTEKPNSTGRRDIFKTTSSISFERRMPAAIPPLITAAVHRAVSQHITRAMWRFSRPRML